MLTHKRFRLVMRKPREARRALERLPGQTVQAWGPDGTQPGAPRPDPTAGCRASRGWAAAAAELQAALWRANGRASGRSPACAGPPAEEPVVSRSGGAVPFAGMAGGFLLEIRRGTQSALLVIR